MNSDSLPRGTLFVRTSERNYVAMRDSDEAAAHPSAAPQGAQPAEAVFLIFFDDYDRRPEIVVGEAAARHRFKEVSTSWNAHLFGKIESNSRDDRYHANNVVIAAASPADAAPVVPQEPSDAKRMDWLDARRDTLIDCFMQDGKLTYILRHPWGAPIAHGNSVRAAIDAAMNAGLTIPAKEQQ